MITLEGETSLPSSYECKKRSDAEQRASFRRKALEPVRAMPSSMRGSELRGRGSLGTYPNPAP